MSVSDSFHDMTMILLPMTNIHDFMIPRPPPQSLKNIRNGLNNPTFLSGPIFRVG